MDDPSTVLAYSPMFHARLFTKAARFRDQHFEPTKASLTSKEKSQLPPYLDGNPVIDRPLIVQFCANKPDELLDAAQYVAPYCDAVDLNLGCPQGIARSGHYGAFLQEDWDTIYKLINKLHNELSVPVTAKMRILETREETLEYAKMIMSAGASILTVHGRRREQKSHNMGIADWAMIRYLRDNLPPETVIFANGNILNHADVETCLLATGADGVLSAEGNLSDPTIFSKLPRPGNLNREYWRGDNGLNGYRIDGVIRRYLDIIYRYVLDQEPPYRPPLFIANDSPSPPLTNGHKTAMEQHNEQPKRKRRKDQNSKEASPNVKYIQGHLFQILRPMLNTHTNIRDALARCRLGDMPAFEHVLSMIEEAVKAALQEEACLEQQQLESYAQSKHLGIINTNRESASNLAGSEITIAKYKRPWWICQPFIRPLPEEALKSGAMQVSKKDLAKKMTEVESQHPSRRLDSPQSSPPTELPQEALVCG